MLSNGEGKVDGDHEIIETNYPLNFKELLPAPINQYAIDRIIQEYNLQKPNFEQSADGSDRTNEISTLPDFDYGGRRNHLPINQINEENTGEVNILAKCGNACGELLDYSSDTPEMQVETTPPTDDEEPEGRKDYYDEVMDKRTVPIAFSAFSSLKKQPTTFADIEKPCQSCNNSNFKKTKLSEFNVPNKRDVSTAAAAINHQKASNILKSKPQLHIALNNTLKGVKNANNSNHGINSSILAKNQKMPNSPKLQFHQHSNATIDSLEEFTFRSPNQSLLQMNSITNESKDADQSNVRIFSSLKHRKKFNNKSRKFLIKSVKLMRVQGSNDRYAKEEEEEDISARIKNFTMKSANKQQNISTANNNEFMNDTVKNTATNNLNLLTVRKKPTNYFLYHMRKPKINDVRNKFHNTSVSDIRRRHIRSNISITENQMNLKKLLPTVVPVRPTPTNSSTEQEILIKNAKTKRPIRTRKVKVFDVNFIKSGKIPLFDLF